MANKPIILSHACIQDTLLLKRLCPEKMTGLALSLYNLNVQTLRRHQLAPYVETKMRPHRYLDLQAQKEELVAEMGAACILHELGIETDSSFRNSAAYIQNWLHVLKDDPKMVVVAAGKAEKAVKLILNVEQAGQNNEGHAAEQAA